MVTHTEQVWLTKDAHNRLTRELAALLALREDGDAGETDVTTQEQREIRIRQLQEVIRNAVVHEPPDDGVVEPGMVLTVRYEGEDDTETFLMAGRAGVVTDTELEVCSPQSPLGRALIGAVPSEQREYRTPDGIRMRVSVLKAVPHRGEGPVPELDGKLSTGASLGTPFVPSRAGGGR
jgi:transcription elongation factor GreA